MYNVRSNNENKSSTTKKYSLNKNNILLYYYSVNYKKFKSKFYIHTDSIYIYIYTSFYIQTYIHIYCILLKKKNKLENDERHEHASFAS